MSLKMGASFLKWGDVASGRGYLEGAGLFTVSENKSIF